jgi:hypothetical protein
VLVLQRKSLSQHPIAQPQGALRGRMNLAEAQLKP